MSNRVTKDMFIERAVEKYGDYYDYEDVKYKGWSVETSIRCPHHGDFKVTPHNHIHHGAGCNWCKYGRPQKKLTRTDFIQKAKQVHGNRYDYKDVDYQNIDKKVSILCHSHGIFEQSPYNHLNGARCIQCWYEEAREMYSHGKEHFIQESLKIHGNKHDYSNVEYVNNKTHVEIICRWHGTFKQTPKEHMKGSGCRDCAYADQGWGADGYYGTDKPATLYVISLSSEGETFIKVGVAKDFKDRLYHFKRETNYHVNLLFLSSEGEANDLFKLEQDILHRSGFPRYKPHVDFRGKTECLTYDCLDQVLEKAMEAESL